MKHVKLTKRRMIAINEELGEKLRVYAEKKHKFLHGSVKAEAEEAIRKHVSGG